LWRIDQETLAGYSREFAVSLMPEIYPELREMLDRQRAAGHFLILASASPEFYVAEIGRELGFHLTLGTPVELGPFFPDLENNKGATKVKRLKELLPASYFENGKLRHSHGYTDSCADLPMLTLCDSASVVNPSSRLTGIAAKSGWEILRPERPWKSRVGFARRALALLLGIGQSST
jgi:phosphoserine phosphatase